MKLSFSVTKKQEAFLSATADEVLFGGAAGGGKSYAQLLDALLYALKYPASKQLILRRTYPELEKSLIRTALGLYPTSLWQYQATAHTGKFINGSIIDFGYLATENDVYRYQSAEYDTIRFDELTHFSEYQYLYMLSRLRGANTFPKQIKSATNPGGVGHGWVKARFIDPSPFGVPFYADGGERVFLPAKLEDNHFLCEADPSYKNRLLLLPDSQKRALLEGDWNVFDGQYFSEFSYEKHTCEPFEIPASWRKWRTIDYGLDCFACLWVAMSGDGDVYVYREFCQENVVISKASEEILRRTPTSENVYATHALSESTEQTLKALATQIDTALIEVNSVAEHAGTLTRSVSVLEADLKASSDQRTKLETVLASQMQLFYEFFMAVNLPQYQKERLGAMYNEMLAAIKETKSNDKNEKTAS